MSTTFTVLVTGFAFPAVYVIVYSPKVVVSIIVTTSPFALVIVLVIVKSLSLTVAPNSL